jgi:ankyrin repeat protein
MRQFRKFQTTVAAVYDRRRFGVQTLVCSIAVALAWSGIAFCGEMHEAARWGDVEKAKALLKSNPDLVNSIEGDGLTPLHLTAQGCDKGQFAEFLFANNADANAKNSEGRTPLHDAAYYGHMKVLAVLLANKANINARDNDGKTPLHLALFVGGKEIAEILLAGGADVTAKDKEGKTPLSTARDMHPLLSSNLGAQEIERETTRIRSEFIALLRKHGAKE